MTDIVRMFDKVVGGLWLPIAERRNEIDRLKARVVALEEEALTLATGKERPLIFSEPPFDD